MTATASMFRFPELHFGLHKRAGCAVLFLQHRGWAFLISQPLLPGRPFVFPTSRRHSSRWLPYCSGSTSGACSEGFGRLSASICALKLAARSMREAASSGLEVDLANCRSVRACRMKYCLPSKVMHPSLFQQNASRGNRAFRSIPGIKNCTRGWARQNLRRRDAYIAAAMWSRLPQSRNSKKIAA